MTPSGSIKNEEIAPWPADDFYTYSARQRFQQINAGRAQALADLEVAKAQADYDFAGAAVQQIADLEAQRQSLVNLHDQYIRSQHAARAAGSHRRGTVR